MTNNNILRLHNVYTTSPADKSAHFACMALRWAYDKYGKCFQCERTEYDDLQMYGAGSAEKLLEETHTLLFDIEYGRSGRRVRDACFEIYGTVSEADNAYNELIELIEDAIVNLEQAVDG